MSALEQTLIHVPAPTGTGNPIQSRLGDRSLIKEVHRDWLDLRCPFGKGEAHSARYVYPSDAEPCGRFECRHCSEKNIADLLRFLDLSPDDVLRKAKIILQPSSRDLIVRALGQELQRGKRIFRCASSLVYVHEENGVPSWHSCLERDVLSLEACGLCNFYKVIRGKLRLIDPPPQVLDAFLNTSMCWDRFPVIQGIVHHPIPHQDGRLITKSGYDQETGLLILSKEDDSFFSPDKPTREDALAALARLNELLEEFPFASPLDQAAALAGIFSAVLRQLLPACPLILVSANSKGAGKSTLCELFSAFASPETSCFTPFPKDAVEMEKRLLALLRGSPPVITFDNVVGIIPAIDVLCTTLTSPIVTLRVLGTSKMLNLSTKTLFLASGNNATAVADMARRTMLIYLNSPLESPASRQFKNPHLIKSVLKARGRYISDVLTIYRAYCAADRPAVNIASIASFQAWANECVRPLVWLGVEDPLEKMRVAMNEDSHREETSLLFSALWQVFADRRFSARDIAQKAAEYAPSDLRAALEDIGLIEHGVLNRKSLGWWLRERTNAIVDGFQLQRVSKPKATQTTYRLIALK